MADTDPDVAAELYALLDYLHDSDQALYDHIAATELSFSQLILLDRLRAGARPTVRQAASIVRVTQGQGSRMVSDLARRGLAQRAGDDRDSRVKRIEITDAGREILTTERHADRLRRVARFTAALSDEDRGRLHAALTPLLARPELAAYRPAAAA